MTSRQAVTTEALGPFRRELEDLLSSRGIPIVKSTIRQALELKLELTLDGPSTAAFTNQVITLEIHRLASRYGLEFPTVELSWLDSGNDRVPARRLRDPELSEQPLAEDRAVSRVRAAARLLPPGIRDRQTREWTDHLACAVEAGEDPQRAARSILLRSVPAIAIGGRISRMSRAFARPR